MCAQLCTSRNAKCHSAALSEVDAVSGGFEKGVERADRAEMYQPRTRLSNPAENKLHLSEVMLGVSVPATTELLRCASGNDALEGIQQVEHAIRTCPYAECRYQYWSVIA